MAFFDGDFTNINGKTALITGGTTGIGRATAVLLAQNGVSVFVFGRHKKELSDAMADIERITGKQAIGMTADVTVKEDIEKIFAEIDRRWGRLDILVNNAGLGGRSIKNSTFEDWDYLLRTNLTGYLHCSQLAVVRMEKQDDRGHIVNVGSLSAYTRDADTDVYSASKAGVAGFSESLRKLVNPDCIKLTLIDPGSVGTDMPNIDPAGQREREEAEKMLKAEDIANMILFSLVQPKRTDVINIRVKPHRQLI